MALESATWLEDLTPVNPVSTDGISQGDDHIRLLKQVLKNQWTSLGSAAVSATAANINLTKTLTADLALKSPLASPSFTGTVTSAGAIAATTGNIDAVAGKLQEVGADLIPAGIILLWSGAISAIPAGWVICDGTAGTPDLTDRFVIHADADTGGTNDQGDTGGVHTQSPSTDSQGAHTHTIASGGSHDHGGYAAYHTLTISQIPSHDHQTVHGTITDRSTPLNSARAVALSDQNDTADDNERYLLTGSDSDANVGESSSTGGGSAHSHVISSMSAHLHTTAEWGDHTHTIASLENRPKFHALVYIQKT